MVGRRVEPPAAFVVAQVVGRNGALADRALLRIEGFQPCSCRVAIRAATSRRAATSSLTLSISAMQWNLTWQRGARIPLFRIRRGWC